MVPRGTRKRNREGVCCRKIEQHTAWLGALTSGVTVDTTTLMSSLNHNVEDMRIVMGRGEKISTLSTPSETLDQAGGSSQGGAERENCSCE
jgi:hypothetical protein